MQYLIFLAAALILILFPPIAAAQEIQFSTYQELARVVTNMQTGNTSALITLQSGSTNDIILPENLRELIIDDSIINSFFLTSKTKCLPGVADESCLLINIQRDPSWPGINAIHEGARIVGDSAIDHVNAAFGVDATFHSIYIHSELDAIPGIANPGTVTVAYTMPTRSSGSMYEKILPIFAEKIKNSGGFHIAASEIIKYPDSSVSFAAIRVGSEVLMQVVVDRSYVADHAQTLFPITLLGVAELETSRYFDDGFYPLNSILQVIILGSTQDSAYYTPDLLQVDIVDGVPIPSSLEIPGWVIEQRDNITDAKYLFGLDKVAYSEDVSISFTAPDEPKEMLVSDQTRAYWPWVLFAIIPIAGVIVLAYVLKKRI